MIHNHKSKITFIRFIQSMFLALDMYTDPANLETFESLLFYCAQIHEHGFSICCD